VAALRVALLTSEDRAGELLLRCEHDRRVNPTRHLDLSEISREDPVQRFGLVAIALSVVACAHSGVVSTGQDTYMIAKSEWGFTSGAVHKAQLLREASEFCAAAGKKMVVISTSQNDVAFGKTPAAEVHFRCVPGGATEQPLQAPQPDGGTSQATLGEVAIMSNVPNADVSVDGKFIGNAPVTSLKLTPGTHLFEVTSKGFVGWKREVTVVQGSATRVVADLETEKQ
jgi:hypothetical protein